MREDQAKTKWCPMVRTVPDAQGYASGNHFEGGSFSERTLCRGSECMMWRQMEQQQFQFLEAPDVEAFIEPQRPTCVPKEWAFVPATKSPLNTQLAGWLEDDASARLRIGGYCGLAGKP